MIQSVKFLLIDSYSEFSGRSGGRSTLHENGNVKFLLIDSYSERNLSGISHHVIGW